MFDNPFQQVAALLVIAAVLGALLRRLQQPLVIAFIVVGLLVGPAFLGLVPANEEIELLAQLGVALLLFIVGLKLDLRLISSLGPVALVTGIGQMATTAVVGYLLAALLGFGLVDAVYIAIALTFSSTIIVVKLLSDRREIDQLHGRIALGVLIVQDIAVVVVMIALSAFGRPQGGVDLLEALGAVAVSGAAFVAAIALVALFVLPRLFDSFARTPELLVLSAAAWALSLAAAGDALGFSEEVGAFLAGVSLASSKYREAIGTRLTTLRDFLLLFFFIQLGLSMDFGDAGRQLGVALVLAASVLIGKPLVVMLLMGALRYRRRISFFTGVSLAQISEFSLIFAALGVSLGHIASELLAMLTLVAVITIALSSYLIVAARRLFERLAPLLAVFERRATRDEEPAEEGLCPSVIVFGLGRFGGRIADHLIGDGYSVLGIDFDPLALGRAERRGVTTMYGDAEDTVLVGRLPLECAEWVVSTSPDAATNVVLLQALRAAGYRGRVALTAHTDVAAKRLEGTGADLLLRPFIDAADDACRALGLADGATARARPELAPTR
ncbi:MAG: cation:proton antiporter [Chloroflexota bacterium]|nr:cation:proton antiporter [Chloroflexota bacterium]